jgi:murein DD-endopeptidase MepM/ murein hydrolase activator NlpD
MRHFKQLPQLIFVMLILGGAVLGVLIPGARGEDDIQKQIDAKNEEIKQLESEASAYRATLGDIGKQANTLAGEIQRLDKSIKVISQNILVTNAKIGKTELEIKELGINIKARELTIDEERGRIGYLIIALASGDTEGPLQILMKNESISAFFSSLDNIVSIQSDIQALLSNLRKEREELKDRKERAEDKRLELAALAGDLADQKALQGDQRKQRNDLLIETKNQEKRYQDLLADAVRKRDSLQQEINTLEAGLKAEFDQSKLPAPGASILGWPLPAPIFITQYFGNTAFARSGAYSGKGHNGVDFRAPNGTSVFAAEGGTVRATGDTDLGCRRASYGRWVLVDHPNNLSTLYAHLSLIKVKAGDGLNRGELVGYSGQTGYATGPHLHFSVFASQAVAISQLKSKVCGRNMTLPLSPFEGYLNPMSYLPVL